MHVSTLWTWLYWAWLSLVLIHAGIAQRFFETIRWLREDAMKAAIVESFAKPPRYGSFAGSGGGGR